MSRILLVWELGSGYGHIGRLLPLAHRLAREGHEPVFAVRDVAVAAHFPQHMPYKVLQAPVWLTSIRGLPPIANHAELLLRFGFHDASALVAMAKAWRALVELVAPDLVLFDHAPTALLATRGLKVRRALFGDGFCSPPLMDPWPPVQWWLPKNTTRHSDVTERILQTINGALDILGAPELPVLSDLYATDENFLLTFRELDHYPQRQNQRYWGPLWQPGAGNPPTWPSSERPRIFAYLDPSAGCFEPLMKAFESLKLNSIVFAPGLSVRRRQELNTRHLFVSREPFDIAATVEQCDAAVTQAGMGTACAILFAGKPQLLVPAYVERSMLAHRIEALGAGIVVAPEQQKPDFRRALKELLADTRYARSASEFAGRHRGFDQHALVDSIAARCSELTRGH